jgi:hypothetical protein
VVAADGDHRDAQVARHAAEEVVEEADGLDRWDGAVVEVAGDQQRVGALGAADGEDLVERVRLLLEERRLVEALAEMPVRGVDEAHDEDQGTPGV